jgi:putative phosphoserine phosphatase/1-acylglycerol-3-phosphate O-acyltransferase
VQPETALAWIARFLRVVCAPFVRFDIAGGEDLNRRIRAAVLAVDHRSLFDVAAGLIVFHRYRRYPRVLIARSYVEGRWTGPFARAIGAIPVDRGSRDGRAIDAAVEVLAEGATILLLPEGRLHWDPEDPISTGPAATGVARIAQAGGVPVVAAGMVGTEKVWPRTRRLPRLNPFRRPVICVRIADHPVDPLDADPRVATDAVMADVRRLMAEAQAAVDAAA